MLFHLRPSANFALSGGFGRTNGRRRVPYPPTRMSASYGQCFDAGVSGQEDYLSFCKMGSAGKADGFS